MKASLLAISISSVLVAPAFATAPQVNVELANQQTLQLIDGQMKAVDASVQYKLNEQYANATPGTTATIDDVTYEKQSNGTWAAVGAASAALVAGLLNSSSSSQDSQNPTLPIEAIPDNELPMSPTPSHPIAHTPSNPIDKDRPVVDKPTDNTNPIMPIPGTDLVLDSTTGLVTKDGVVVASVERDGLITATINIHGSDDVIKVWYDANGVNVDWNNSTIDNGWGHVATPTNPIDKNRPVVDKPADNTNPIMPIPGTDLVLDSTTGLVTKDGVVVASVERDGLITATINIHGSDDVIKVWYDANGVNIDWNNSIVDNGWGHVATPTNPIDKDRPVIDKPTDNENNHYQISGAREGNEGHYGYFSINGEEVAYLEYSDGQLVVNAYDSTVAKQYDVRVIDTENNGSKLVVIGGDNTTEGQLVHINPEGVVTPIDAEKAKSSLQSIDRSKLQSIDPTKLQKAKSTIQQRLRG
ncbi:conserved exported hypothetical protein [Vibrio chagasii]|nr:conserved exported hypothetical protein [Vibrio chagasii]CAH6974781.1 conserved exported hypothetical protein [Vibrio chagasii]